jgi:succinate-acetate transporter protein
MAGDSIDLDALQSTTAESGADILSTEHGVQRVVQAMSKNGAALSAMIICWLLFTLHMKRCSFACNLSCFNLLILVAASLSRLH